MKTSPALYHLALGRQMGTILCDERDSWGSFTNRRKASTVKLGVVPENLAERLVLCRRHPQLHSTILELPQAIKHAAALLEKEGMSLTGRFNRIRIARGRCCDFEASIEQRWNCDAWTL